MNDHALFTRISTNAYKHVRSYAYKHFYIVYSIGKNPKYIYRAEKFSKKISG